MRSAIAIAVLLPLWAPARPIHSQSVVAHVAEKPHSATAVVLLESSSAHGYSGNQEVYVADLRLPGKKEPQLVKMVDRYPGYGNRIDHSALALSRPLRVVVTRDPACDMAANRVFLPSSKQGEFDPDVRHRLEERGPEVLPCFLLDHDTARLAKH